MSALLDESKFLAFKRHYLLSVLTYEESYSISISRQNFNKNLETLHLAPTQFDHLPVLFYLKTGFVLNHPLSFG